MAKRKATEITQARKEASHKRIIHAAARAIRRDGYGGASVATIMQEAGLTHGGFYAHFESREDMLAHAADAAGAESVAALDRVAAEAPAPEALNALVDAYLSSSHVGSVDSGCPVAALGSEMPRQSAGVRRAATRRIRDMIATVERAADRGRIPKVQRNVLADTATLVGALILARAVDDTALAAQIIESVKRQLKQG